MGTSYLLTSVITVPIFGKLGDEHGRKPFVIAAIILFTVASMLCGMAQSMLQLVLARALQGVGRRHADRHFICPVFQTCSRIHASACAGRFCLVALSAWRMPSALR
ncbi:MAG: MFS transporter [Nitrosomonadales bacterium]